SVFATASFEKSWRLVKPIRRKRRSQIRVPETLSVFNPLAQRNAFRRRDVLPQRRSFARWNQSLRRSPTLPGFAEIVRDDFPVFHAAGCASFPLHIAMIK